MQIPLFQQKIATWRQILRQNFTHIDRLTDFLELSVEQRFKLISRSSFPLNLPLRLAEKIKKGTLEDPILRQFVPLVDENQQNLDYFLDPVSDTCFKRSSKLLHKYEGRALLVCTSACAMHCRYCFRQNFDYDVENKTFEDEISIITNDSSIKELILSGGDPLSLSNDILDYLLKQATNVPHIKRIRFHSRFPIGIPERIDEDFLGLIASLSQQVWFVIHCNHPAELDPFIFKQLKELQKLGCTVVNQSVLLQGVNDDVQVLKLLCEELVDHGILPYYLHQLDRVQGAAHFEVDENKGRALIKELAAVLPGYAVPKYVREIAGQPNKTPL